MSSLSALDVVVFSYFFFQAEDGIRDLIVTGVQTCALPIWISQGSLYPSSQRASNVQATWLRVKARPVPRQLVPGRGAKLSKGRQQVAPVGRKLPPVLMRKNGCQPKRVMRRNSHGAYKPRSASTITVQPRGMAGPSRRSRRGHSPPQGCLRPAGTHTH